MKTAKKVFISSTLRDLRDYRRAVRSILGQGGLDFIDNENLGAMSDEPVTAMYQLIDQCDVFIGIYARYYGRIPEGQQRSYIELEYEYAKSKRKPTLCFVLDQKWEWPKEFSENDPQLQKQLYRFIQKIVNERVVSFFTTPEDLAAKVLVAVQKYLSAAAGGSQKKKPPRKPRPKKPLPTAAPVDELGYVEADKTPRTDSDQPFGPDRLNYNEYANAFAEIILNVETNTPLTIGIYGQWGQGKSFLMEKIKQALYPRKKEKGLRRSLQLFKKFWDDWQDIRFYFMNRLFYHKLFTWRDLIARIRQRRVESVVGFRFVHFNAWEYVGTEHLWAGLVTKLYEEVQQYLGLQFHLIQLRRAFRRSFPKSFAIFAFYALLGLAISLILNLGEISKNFDTLIKTFSVSALGGAGLAGLPILWKALKDFADGLFLTRSQSLQNLVTKPDFKSQIGVMGDIKKAVVDLCTLLEIERARSRKLTRFILFIDDLDRCDHKKAVEVLQAIMILLNFREGAPFVTFLALDARVLVRAIEATYSDVLVKAGINGYEYLDKIVQLPFVIPHASEDEIKTYVGSLVWGSEDEKSRVAEKQKELQEKRKETAPSPAPPEPKEPAANKAEKVLEQPIAEFMEGPDPNRIATLFTQAERTTLEKCSGDLIENPRKIKRIINIYAFIRKLFPETMDREKAIHWVLMTEQWPFHVAWLLEEIKNDEQTKKQELDDKALQDVYKRVRKNIMAAEMSALLEIDADPDVFEQFIKKPPILSVKEIKELKRFTFNLNPAIRAEVSKQAIRISIKKAEAPTRATRSKRKVRSAPVP